MNTQRSIIDNGLRIVTAEMSESQSVTAAVFVGVGSRYEDWAVNGGVSHMLEHLLFKGTAKRPSAKQISEEIDAVGGWNNAYTSNDLTCFHIKVPKQHAVLALDILSDLVTDPLFDPVELDREREVILEEMSMIKDDPARYVGDLIMPLLWPDDPLGREIIGDEKVVKTISRQAIIDFKNQYYGSNNIVVAVAGQISHAAVVDQVSRQMGGLKPVKLSPSPKPRDRLSERLVKSLSDDTNQVHFLIGGRGFSIAQPDEVVARAVAAILGRGMSSRLFVKVRSMKGLAYEVSAECQSFVEGGAFEIYAGTNADKVRDAIEAIMEELALIRIAPVEKLELMKAKNQLRAGLQMGMEGNANVADRLGSELILLDRIWSIEELLAEIDAVSLEDVQRVAAKMLSPERLRMAIIAPDPRPAEKTFKEAVAKSYAKS